MSVFPLVKGTRLRATKINSCGLPIAGAANRIVTSGFVTVTLSAEMRDADDLEQTNAEGRVCVQDRTPPQRKWYNASVELCNVNTGLISLFNGWEQVLDWNNKAVGFRDQMDVEADYGVAIEVWTGGKADDECAIPTTDEILASPTSGKKYGYLLFGGKEWVIGDDITIGAQVSTLTLSGITIAMPQWGKGPYNVQESDADGTPGRLLNALNNKQHFEMFRTAVAPPAETAGSEPAALAVSSIFTGTKYYFGGPASAPPIAVAPAQPV